MVRLGGKGGGSVAISLDGLAERDGLELVQCCKIPIKHNLVPADKENPSFDDLYRHKLLAGGARSRL
jgi:prephenate dehydratase